MGHIRIFPGHGNANTMGADILSQIKPTNPEILGYRAPADVATLKVVGKKLSAMVTDRKVMTELVANSQSLQQAIGNNSSIKRAIEAGKLNKLTRKNPNDPQILGVTAVVVGTLLNSPAFTSQEKQSYGNDHAAPGGYYAMQALASNRAIGFSVFTGTYYNRQESEMPTNVQEKFASDRKIVATLCSATKVVQRSIGNRSQTNEARNQAPTVVSTTKGEDVRAMLKGLTQDENQFALVALNGHSELKNDLQELAEAHNLDWNQIANKASNSKAQASLQQVRNQDQQKVVRQAS